MFASIPRWLRFVVYTQVVLIFAIPLGGWLAQSALEAWDMRVYPPPGRMISLGDRRIHVYCEGERGDAPLVVFNAGMGDHGLVWRAVQQALSGHPRSCAIDRAGFGWSDPGETDRGIAGTAHELHAVLEASGEAPPYLVVGHGLGALQGLVLASEYPDETAGLVLVDPLPPECLGERLRGIASNAAGTEQEAIREKVEEIIAERGECPEGDGGAPLLSWLARIGMVRALAGSRFDASAPTPELLKVHRALRFRAQAADAMLAEAKSAYVGMGEARNAMKSLANRPVAILSPGQIGSYAEDGRRIELQADPAALAFERAQLRYLQQRQKQMAFEAPAGIHRIAPHSGRYIQISEPELVADAIEEVVKATHSRPQSNPAGTSAEPAAPGDVTRASGRRYRASSSEPVTLSDDEQY